jgi:hypothetical protein
LSGLLIFSIWLKDLHVEFGGGRLLRIIALLLVVRTGSKAVLQSIDETGLKCVKNIYNRLIMSKKLI